MIKNVYDQENSCEQGSIPERNHLHTCVSSTMPGFIRGDLRNKPVESNMDNPQRGSFEIDVSRVRVLCEVQDEDGTWRGRHRSQAGGCSGSTCLVEWESGRAPSVTGGTDQLQC